MQKVRNNCLESAITWVEGANVDIALFALAEEGAAA